VRRKKQFNSGDEYSKTRGVIEIHHDTDTIHIKGNGVFLRFAPRVSLLLFPSCSFPDMHTAITSFSWFKSSVFDWFPRIIGIIIGILAKRLGFPENLLVLGEDERRVE